MFKSLFTLYLLLHLTGDFILQTDGQSRKKEENPAQVLLHALLYSLPYLAVGIFVACGDSWFIQATILSIGHLLVDMVKYVVVKFKHSKGPLPFVVDQIVHLAMLAAMAVFTLARLQPPQAADWFHRMTMVLEIDDGSTLAWLCMLLIIWKPVNITIRKVLATHRPNKEEDSTTKTGAMIGTLERVTMLLLLGMGQYAAIALVLTAKSIARYDLLKDKSFAEYYLLGTLLSTVSVLIVFLLLSP